MIKHDNVYLTPIELEDIELLNKWKNDEDVYKYLGGGYRPISVSQQRKWMDILVENNLENQRYIILDEDYNKVGFIGLYNISPIHRTCSLGLYIGEKESWGKGIASKAYRALECYAKMYLNIRKINLEVIEKNENAVKMYQKLGFDICGKHKEERFIDGKYEDLLIMEKFIMEDI